MRFGPLVIMEKGVAFGVSDKQGNGIGLLYDRVEASGVKFERSAALRAPMLMSGHRMITSKPAYVVTK